MSDIGKVKRVKLLGHSTLYEHPSTEAEIAGMLEDLDVSAIYEGNGWFRYRPGEYFYVSNWEEVNSNRKSGKVGCLSILGILAIVWILDLVLEASRSNDSAEQSSYSPAITAPANPGDPTNDLPEVRASESALRSANEPSISCFDSMRLASLVPLSQTNDRELSITINACKSVDEWVRALKRYPTALGVANPTADEIEMVLTHICQGNPSSPVCS